MEMLAEKAVPNAMLNGTLASKLESAKTMGQLGRTLFENRSKILLLAVHPGFANWNSVPMSRIPERHLLLDYEKGMVWLYREKLAGFDRTIFVLGSQAGSERDMKRIFGRHGGSFAPEITVADSPDGYIINFAKDAELLAIKNLIEKTEKLEAVLAYGMYRHQCLDRGINDFKKILSGANKGKVEVVANRLLAIERSGLPG